MHAAEIADEFDGQRRSRVWARNVRATIARTQRRAAWTISPRRYPAPIDDDGAARPVCLFHERVPIDRDDPHAEPAFEAGKRHNVALAAPSFDRLVLQPGVAFSFWKTLGPVTAELGYRHGMELRGGCVIPTIGGGLCLLSNALFRAAATLGWTIIERHGHTIEAVPTNDALWGLDATIAYPYVDLRFALPQQDPSARLDVVVRDGVLDIRVWANAPLTRTVTLTATDDRVDIVDGARIRSNRIVRRIVAGDTTTEHTVATNAKRVLDPAHLGRSCLTCGIEHCPARVTI